MAPRFEQRHQIPEEPVHTRWIQERQEKSQVHDVVHADMIGRERREDVLDVEMYVVGKPPAMRILRSRDIKAVNASDLGKLARHIDWPNPCRCVSYDGGNPRGGRAWGGFFFSLRRYDVLTIGGRYVPSASAHICDSEIRFRCGNERVQEVSEQRSHPEMLIIQS